MSNTTRLIAMRSDLEAYLKSTQIEDQSQAVELAIYDSILRARINYEDRVGTDLDTILYLIGSSSEIQESLGKKGADFKVKSKLINWLVKYGHSPAYIFVLNFDPDNPKHKQHVFGGNTERGCVGKSVFDNSTHEELDKIAYEDNAVLFLPDGTISATNVQLVNVKPVQNGGYFGDETMLYQHYGFSHPVHTRHFSSLGASSHLTTTVVYALGEAGHIRRFSEGKISFSTVNGES